MADEKQDMCPICCEPFEFKQVVVDFERWEDEKLKAHLDCLLYLSATEDGRKQRPPRMNLK